MSKFGILSLMAAGIFFGGLRARAVTLGAAIAQCEAQIPENEASLACTYCGCTVAEGVIYYSGASGAGRVTETISVIPYDDNACNPGGIYEGAGISCEFASGSVGTQIPMTDTSSTPVCAANSSVNMDDLSLTESVPLVGMSFALNYSSARTRATSTFSPQALGLGGWTPTPVHHYDSTKNMIYYGNGDVHLVTAQTISGGGYYATDQAGTEVYYFDSSGNHTQTKDALTGVVKYNFTYNTDGTLASISDQFSNSTTFVNSSGNMLMTSPYGQVTTLTFDSQGLLASVINPNSETYTIVNDDNGFLSTFTKPLGQTATMAYDGNGYVTGDVSSSGRSLNLNYTFNSSTHTQVVNSWDVMGNYTVFTTVAASNSSSTHNILDFVGMTQTSSDTVSTSHADTDGYGNAYSVAYSTDPRFGSMVSVPVTTSYTVPSSSISLSTSLSQSATLSTSTDPFSFTTLTQNLTLQGDSTRVFSSVYNKTAGTLTSTSPVGRTLVESLNTNGQPSSIQAGSLTALGFTYDTHGRVSTVTQGTRTSTITYDSHSNVATSTDALGHQTQFGYDSANRLTSETLPDGNSIAMTYDANGNMTSVTPPGKTAHSFMYSGYDWASEYLSPSAATTSSNATTYTYYANGKLNTVTLPTGDSIQYNYDYSTERLTAIYLPIGSFSLTYVTNSDLVSTITAPSGETLTYTYAGNIPTSVTTAGTVNSLLQFTFNTDGTVATIASGPNSTGLVSTSLGYDKDGLLTSVGDETLTLNNVGAVSGSSVGGITEALTFDSFGGALTDQFATTTATLYAQTNTRDSVGRILTTAITAADTLGGSATVNAVYTYDLQGRLSTAKTGDNFHRYTYDANGNRTGYTHHHYTKTGVYDAQDRLSSYGDFTFSYNDNGIITQMVQTTTGTSPTTYTTNYTADLFGDITSVTLPNSNVISYVLDGQNRRIGKLVNGTLTQGFIYQSQTQIAAELDASGNVVSTFIYGSKANIPDLMINGGVEYRIISNHVGTPQMIVNTSTGAVVRTYSFDEFGVFDGTSGTGPTIPFGFAGGLADADTGLVQFGKRAYLPMVGRFVSKDSLLFDGGDTNLYAYTLNDPNNFIDPSGNTPAAVLPLLTIPFLPEIAIVAGGAAVAYAGWELYQIYTKKLTDWQWKNLQDNTGKHPEEIKEELIGPKESGKWDLYIEDDGRITARPKNGKTCPVDTGYNKGDLKRGN